MATRSITFRDIISFSAEHPQNKVQNLLKTGKTGKWTSPKHHPEPIIDVELSLPPCYIKSLDVGNHWTAVLEIEVGSKEGKNKREPLLKSPSTLMSRIDCQIGSNKDAMKFYTADDDFTTTAKNRSVDRIRFICKQPFRRDVLFGLSTVAIRGISVDDLDAHASSSPGYSTNKSPTYSSNDDFESSLKNAVGLAGLANAYKNMASTASNSHRNSTGKEMSEAEINAGVQNLKSKLSKQKTPTQVPPKAKYASLFASLDAGKKEKKSPAANPLKSKAQKQSPAQSRKRKVEDDNAKNSKNLYSTSNENKVINLNQHCDIDESDDPELALALRMSLETSSIESKRHETIMKQQNKKFVFKKKAAVAAAKEAAQKAAAENASPSNKIHDGSNGKVKQMQNDHLQDIQLTKSTSSHDSDTTYDNFNLDEPILNEKKQKGLGQSRRKSKKKSIEELLGPSAREITTLDNKFDSLLQSPSPQHNTKSKAKDIRSKYDNFDYNESSSYEAFDDGGRDSDSSQDLFSNRVDFKVPKDYLKYNDDEVREMGILVQVRQYKKDKFLPLTDGSEVKVDKGTFVTFYKNAQQIHMKINDKMHVPDVEPDHIAGIFKDYTEKEINDSDKIRSITKRLNSEPKPLGMGVLQTSVSNARTNKASNQTPNANSKVSKASTNQKSKGKKKDSPSNKNVPIGRAKKPGANKKVQEEKTEDSDSDQPPIKKSRKMNNINSSALTTKKATPKKGPTTKSPKNKSAKKTNKKVDTDSESAEDESASSPSPKPKSTPSRKRVSNSGGECPLCSRTFSRTRDLMEHCSTCEGTGGGTSSGSSGGRGKTTSKTPKPAPPKVNMSECPICGKKVPTKDLERHARLCAENMFG